MRLLVDTHLLLWWLAGGSRLPKRGAAMLADPTNEAFFSAASLWEVAIKSSLGKLRVDPDELLGALADAGFRELPVTWSHAARVARLPDHHPDPFDRLLVAQSLVETIHLLTDDRQLSAYGPSVILV